MLAYKICTKHNKHLINRLLISCRIVTKNLYLSVKVTKTKILINCLENEQQFMQE